MKRQLLFAALLALAASAAAQETPIRYMPEPDFDGIIARTLEGVKPHDAFEGVAACRVADAQFIKPVSLEEARQLLAPCVAALTATYGKRVAIGEGTVSAQGRMSAQVEVLMLEVPAGTGVEAPVMKDLNKAVAARGGRLLGHPAVVVAEQRKTPQEALNECILPMVVREISTGADFIKAYGVCLRKIPEFGIVEMQPWPSKPLGVILLTKADHPVAESLTTAVEVSSLEGPVKVELIAYASTTALDR